MLWARWFFQCGIGSLDEIGTETAQVRWAVCSRIPSDLFEDINVHGRIQMSQDKSAKRHVCSCQSIQVRQSTPVVDKNPGNRFTVAFGNGSVVALTVQPV